MSLRLSNYFKNAPDLGDRYEIVATSDGYCSSCLKKYQKELDAREELTYNQKMNLIQKYQKGTKLPQVYLNNKRDDHKICLKCLEEALIAGKDVQSAIAPKVLEKGIPMEEGVSYEEPEEQKSE